MAKTTREILRDMRYVVNLSQAKFAAKYEIPLSTIESWELGNREPAPYVLALLAHRVAYDSGATGAYLKELYTAILTDEEGDDDGR